jgi:hypothetical protein
MTDKDRTRRRPAPRKTSSSSARPRRRKAGTRKTRAELVERLWRAVAAQVTEAETRLAAMPGDTGEALARPEEAAKLLASLARTLKELDGLDQPDTRTKASDDSPRDIDAFRAELARKLERVLAIPAHPGLPGATDAGGT